VPPAATDEPDGLLAELLDPVMVVAAGLLLLLPAVLADATGRGIGCCSWTFATKGCFNSRVAFARSLATLQQHSTHTKSMTNADWSGELEPVLHTSQYNMLHRPLTNFAYRS
jgi:UPF0716 family protein affecting phage T7 exclusion